MTSLFAQNCNLSPRTQEAYTSYGASPQIIDQRLRFYLLYLEDVIPFGLTVRHIPAPLTHLSSREEIQILTYGGKIFMSGLVSMDRTPTATETIAGDEAYTKWDNGDFMRDGDRWRFFSGLGRIRFLESLSGDEYGLVGELDPVGDAEDVAGYLQREFDRIEQYH